MYLTSLGEAVSVDQERRRTPRYSFVATAELIETDSEVRIASRVSELSLHGCYLDMINPFPVGTKVLVKISAGDVMFQAPATVVFSKTNLGAGLKFDDLDKDHATILERWLEDAHHNNLQV